MKTRVVRFLKNHGYFIASLIWLSLSIILLIGFSISARKVSAGLNLISNRTLLFSVLSFLLVYSGAGFLIGRFHLKWFLPMLRLKQTAHVLVERDYPSLSRRLSNLTTGNLTQKMHLHSPYPPSDIPREWQPMAEVLHVLRDNLSAIADDFNSITDAPCKRFAFIGSDPVAEGKKCAELMAELLGNKGDILIMTGFLFNTTLELRRKSFAKWVSEHSDMIVVETFESMMSMEFSQDFIEDLLETHPKIKGIYATDAMTVSIIAEILSTKTKYKKIKLIGHDITHENVQFLNQGQIHALIDQNPYIQGYNSVIFVYNHLVEGWIPPKPQMYIPADIVTQANIDEHWHASQKWILSREKISGLAKPATTPPTQAYRIAFLAREDMDIWSRIKTGAMAAMEALSAQNVTVQWIIPSETKEKADFSALIYSKEMKRLIHDKDIDAVITFVEDVRLIESINAAVDAGIPVMTINTEPLNLRSLIQTLDAQSYRLAKLSRDLETVTQHVIIATTEIRNAITTIADGTMVQNSQVDKTRSTLESLLNSIDQISRESDESTRSSENTIRAVASGTQAIEETLSTLKSIAKSVINTKRDVEELRLHSNRIDDVVNILNTIASKVKILALNASIESTQSGRHQVRFHQVASEISKLAMNTSEANREVAVLIETIKRDIKQVEKAMRISTELIGTSDELAKKTDSALENINMLVGSDRERIKTISEAIQEMQSISHQVGLSMDQLSMASSKNSTSVSSVNSSIKEMFSQLENVKNMATQLQQMAQGEGEFLAMFETKNND
jgi:methyl-accepting chemotaxis protein